MDAAAELGRNPVSKHQIRLSMEMSRLTRDGTAEPISRDQILRHARGQGNINFPVQLTTSRIGNLTRLIHILLSGCDDHPYIHTTPLGRTNASGILMTRMTGPDCVVMCNLINTYIHNRAIRPCNLLILCYCM